MRLFHLLRNLDSLPDIVFSMPDCGIEAYAGDNQMDMIMVGVDVAHAMPHPGIRIKPHAGQEVPCDLGPPLIRQFLPRRQGQRTMPDRLFYVGPDQPRDRKFAGKVTGIESQHITRAYDWNSAAWMIIFAWAIQIIQ